MKDLNNGEKLNCGEKTCDNCDYLHFITSPAKITYFCYLFNYKTIGEYEKPRLPECLAAEVRNA